MSEIGKIVGLRCPHCGAALPETEKDLVRCRYCGSTARVEDADKYLQHLQGFVLQWVRTALPLGLGGAYSTSIDQFARHSIFAHSVFPNINSEFSQVQLDAFEAFASPLIVPPFVRRSFSFVKQKDPKSLFSYDAKISSVLPLATTPDDQAAVQKMGGLSRAFAHVLIGLDLLEKTPTLSYKAIAENFEVAATSIENQYDVLSKRLLAISKIYRSIDEALSKKLVDSRKKVEEAKALLEEALSESTLDINLSICTSAIEQEIEVAKTVSLVVDLMESDQTGDQLESVRKIENFFSTSSTTCQTAAPIWRQKFENLGRYSELARWFCLILGAKSGKTPLKVTSGMGNMLFPFWVTEINYTFGTGALWLRKGKCVTENALVAATFPLYQGFSISPSEVVTDIFSMRPEGALVGSITGSEMSISSGQNISRLVQQATLRSASSYKVVLPLSTRSEAKQLMNEYLQQVSRGLQGKLQIASCDVSDILFVPVDVSTGFINFHGALGYVQPRKVGDIGLITSVAV